jgi:transcriptional regulator of met regulon
MFSVMAECDASQKALEQVQKITESDPVNGEDLLGSDDLKRQLREAKEAEAKEQRKHEPPSP